MGENTHLFIWETDLRLIYAKLSLVKSLNRIIRKPKSNTIDVAQGTGPPRPKVSVIIPSWNHRELLRNCLHSILNHTDYDNYEIIVVDDGSSDGTSEMIETSFPDVKVIINPENVGFAAACNRAMAISDADFFCIVNDDMEVSDGWLENAIDIASQDQRIACVVATGAKSHDDLLRRRHYYVKKVETAAGLYLFRAETVRKMGGFDHLSFSPIYGEEIDWHLRARNLGYKIVETNKIPLVHMGEVTATEMYGKDYTLKLKEKNRLKAYLYNDSLPSLLRRIPFFTYLFLIKGIRKGKVGLFLQIYTSILRDFDDVLRKRRKRRSRGLTLSELVS